MFETPYEKKTTRVLDDAAEQEPYYNVARGKILQAVFGSEGLKRLEERLEKRQGNSTIQMYVSDSKALSKP